MSTPFARLIQEIALDIPQVQGQSSTAWGARHQQFRQEIRQSVEHSLTGWHADDLVSLSNLSEPPRPRDWSISISHTLDLGGWLAVPRPAQIGWDVEVKDRIKMSVIERVSSRDEIEQAPQAAFLWAAKESFYKALEDEQPLAIPQLTIGFWRARSSGLWSWQGLGPRNGEGLLLQSPTWILAACLIR